MIMITLYSVLYVFFLWIDYPKVKNCGRKSVGIFYLTLTVLSYILIILIAFDIPIPNPTVLMEKLVTSVININ